jgi:hypothetical protein
MTASALQPRDDADAEEISCVGRRARWSLIADRTIYFGHQSVGTSVCVGIHQLANDSGVPLRLVQTHEPEAVAGPAFVHFLAGRHRDYASKNAALLRLLDSRTRARDPIVILKFCHGDINSLQDGKMLFDAYSETVDTIQDQHPDVALIHATIPLATVGDGARERVKRVLGRTTQREAAIARHRYNELVRSEFGAYEPVFDIARIQATAPDGVRAGFSAEGTRIDLPATENTIGASALSSECRAAAAEALLDVISSVAGTC